MCGFFFSPDSDLSGSAPATSSFVRVYFGAFSAAEGVHVPVIYMPPDNLFYYIEFPCTIWCSTDQLNLACSLTDSFSSVFLIIYFSNLSY